MKPSRTKRALCFAIIAAVACIHVLHPAQYLDETILRVYRSYFSDVAIPFAYYFLFTLSQQRLPFLRSWFAKSILVFWMAATAETLQAFGVHALGATFDPLDYVMYAIGVSLAALLEKKIFERKIASWMANEG